MLNRTYKWCTTRVNVSRIRQAPLDFTEHIERTVGDRSVMLRDFIGQVEEGLQEIVNQLVIRKKVLQ